MSGARQTPPGGGAQEDGNEQHEDEVGQREAYEYWGYLFKPDKTGTDKLKGLLRGLKDYMNKNYEHSDNPDLTPSQLANFYRDLHGNYDQLFLGTPSESIAFIYKSLGCLHSLQPLSHSTAFTDPTVPALKTEGWIMWQTIQLLLGPEEHSSFLIEAAQKWEVRDPATGEVLPRILPRQCFPMEPDKHMVAWYEGVSERLRRESDDEERQRDIEAEQAEVRRLRDRRHEDTDDEGSVDSRGPALAYFRNPLYRHVDGRPTIVRRGSKRPTLSPRPTMMDRGKGAANTVGHVFRNIGSPHLWDGRNLSKSYSHERDRSHRRRSLPNNGFHQPGDPPPSTGYDARPSPGLSAGHSRRHGSTQLDRSPLGAPDEEWQSDHTPLRSPRPGSRHQSSRDDADPSMNRSRSHEPTPSQKDYPDYFHGYDDPDQYRDSSQPDQTPPLSANGVGPSFGPSASPLFASHLARQPQPQAPAPRRPPSGEPYGSRRRTPSFRRDQDRQYSRSPAPGLKPRDRDDRRYSSRERRPQHDRSPQPMYDNGPTSAPPMQQPGFPPVGTGPGDTARRPQSNAPPESGGYPPSGPMPSRDRRSGRSGSDVSYSGPEDRDDSRRRSKQTRFASGVDGRRYPKEDAWR